MNTNDKLRRLKGLLVITSARMKSNEPELAMNTLALAMEHMDGLSPEDISTGLLLESDLADLVPHDPATTEITEVAARTTFSDMMSRMMVSRTSAAE